MNRSEIRRRFGFHPADTPEKQQTHEEVRDICEQATVALLNRMPAHAVRERATVVSKMEEAMFWGNAGVARPPADGTENSAKIVPRDLMRSTQPNETREGGPIDGDYDYSPVAAS